MKIIYITLNNDTEAKKVGHKLIENKLVNCVNFFPITCIYNYENEVVEEPEVVLIAKTQDDRYQVIKETVKSVIDYDNFIGELGVTNINDDFTNWLNSIVK
ncbi:divalent cation tolerance protein CutA [Candidatus Dojkabacteria bacterium]|uniref:Divalent cation tolerance protein CutA n=1 Tax=Candidatus Dojkabacteria bacterium TaxID=2099670 RepID=A0A955L953_9BACT|nr:divalent cation tolerance protein CutA [Candidatus Dojkabacteria bacterium]